MECDGERALCPDLVGATVIEHRVADYALKQNCYSFVNLRDGYVACMELNLTTRTCTIYFDKHPGRKTRLHEQNHCRGWAHETSVRGREVHYRWRPMPELGGVQPFTDERHIAKEGGE